MGRQEIIYFLLIEISKNTSDVEICCLRSHVRLILKHEIEMAMIQLYVLSVQCSSLYSIQSQKKKIQNQFQVVLYLLAKGEKSIVTKLSKYCLYNRKKLSNDQTCLWLFFFQPISQIMFIWSSSLHFFLYR